MWQFEHEEIVDAPVEVVFKLISDLPNYPNWNPFLIIARGKVEMGGVISGKSVLGKRTTSYRHKIFEYIEFQARFQVLLTLCLAMVFVTALWRKLKPQKRRLRRFHKSKSLK
jgi:hypothetical protein